VRQFNKTKGTHEDVDVGGLDLKEEHVEEVAFTFRKTVSEDVGNKLNTYSEIDVEAPGLRTLLRECVGTDYPGQNFDGETVNLAKPFEPLVRITARSKS
jgi:hypothetical protein